MATEEEITDRINIDCVNKMLVSTLKTKVEKSLGVKITRKQFNSAFADCNCLLADDPTKISCPPKRAAQAAAPKPGITTAPTKAQMVSSIAQSTSIDPKDVEKVLDELVTKMKHALCLDGPGKIQMSNLFKITVVRDSGTPVVDIKPMKRLQDIANQKLKDI